MLEQFTEKLNNISRVLVLCSSGLDSVYNLFEALKRFKTVEVLFFDYGQKAQAQEYLHLKKICAKLKLKFTKIDLQWYRDISISSSLLSNKRAVTRYKGIDAISGDEKPAEWVPNRNGVMVNVAAAYADAWNFEGIIIGINKEEAGRYPDNTQEFVDRCSLLFEYSTLARPIVFSFSAHMLKAEILERFTSIATEFDISPQIIWSCYESYEKMCGACESCVRLKEVLSRSGRMDEWRGSFLR